MLHDARSLDDGTTLTSDVCIIGAGPAGITMARALAGSDVRVCLLESGGFDFEDDIQDLYAGDNVGVPYFELDVCRLRYFGGTSNHWEGRCRPLDAIDFEARDWVPLSGWPITRADLDPYYEQAHPICQIGPYVYDPEALGVPEELVLALDRSRFFTQTWHYSPPTRFGELYRDEVVGADNVDVVLHGNLLDIDSDDEGRVVKGLTIGTLDGKRHTARARAYVLACGGLENARLLLASNRKVNVGLGNKSDMVGRCFMEHLNLTAGKALLADPEAMVFYDYGLRGTFGEGAALLGCLTSAPELQRKAKLLNFDGNVTTDNVGDSGYAALRRVWNSLERGDYPSDLSGDLWQALIDVDDTFAGLLGRFGIKEYQSHVGRFRVWSCGEQVPNPDSRVVLDDARDAFGMPRIRLDWRLTELDKRSLLDVHKVLGEEFGRFGVGRLKIDGWLMEDLVTWPPDLMGQNHHMGTTRMTDDPKSGVVDRDCRVHGMDNLYVAGSSVFTTSGAANPTLTIVAMALRLADTLRARLTG